MKSHELYTLLQDPAAYDNYLRLVDQYPDLEESEVITHLRNHMHVHGHYQREEVPMGADLAVPDEAFTIGELLERHRAGMLTDMDLSGQNRYYDGNEIDDDDDSHFDEPDLGKLAGEDILVKEEFLKGAVETIKKGRKPVEKPVEPAPEKGAE